MAESTETRETRRRNAEDDNVQDLCVMRDGHRWCGEPAVGDAKLSVGARKELGPDVKAASGSVHVCLRHEAILREVIARQEKNDDDIPLADDPQPSEPRPVSTEPETSRARDIPATAPVQGMRTTGTVLPGGGPDR